MWEELGDGVLRRRYEWVDVNVGLVIGDDGALVVDTRTTPLEGAELRRHVAEVTSRPVRWVVNTHWHWDHVLGNAEFADADTWGHEACASHVAAHGDEDVAAALEWFPAERHGELDGVRPIAPQRTFTDGAAIHLGGRVVELRFFGLGHTDSDLSVAVPDADVVFAGDLLESGAPPFFGDGHPIEWPATLRFHLEMGTVFVPGHGAVMDAATARGQHGELEAVAAVCRRALAEGAAADAADLAGAPYPAETMRVALARAIATAGR